MKQPRAVDYDLVFRLPTMDRPQCWETCDSFCCSPKRVTKNFGFLGKVGTDLYLLPGELDHLRNLDKMQEGFEDTLQTFEVPLPDGGAVPIYQVTCKLCGPCTFHEYRPLICRTYPYFPIVEPDGSISGMAPQFSLFDTFFPMIKQELPCTVRDLTPKETANFQTLYEEVFSDPVNILLFMTAHWLKTELAAQVSEKYPQIADEEEADFWDKWEKLFLYGRLVDRNRFYEQVAQFSNEIESVWGLGAFQSLGTRRGV